MIAPATRRALLLLCLLAGLALPSPARAQSTQVVLNPATGTVAVNQTLAVAVEVHGVADLYGVDITVTYDPAVVEVVDAYPDVGGTQVAQGTFLDPGFVLINSVDNQAGSAHFAMTQLNPSEAKNGTGSLVVVTLRGKQANKISPLNLADVQLASRSGVAIEVTPVSGQVQVTSQPSAGATNTPVPTVGAGTVFPSPAGATAVPATPLQPNPTQTAAPGLPSATGPAAAPTTDPGAPPATAGAPTPAAQPQATSALPGSTAAASVSAPTETAIASGQSAASATPRVLAMAPTRTEMAVAEAGAATLAAGGDAGPGGGAGASPDGLAGVRTVLWVVIGAAIVVLFFLLAFALRWWRAR